MALSAKASALGLILVLAGCSNPPAPAPQRKPVKLPSPTVAPPTSAPASGPGAAPAPAPTPEPKVESAPVPDAPPAKSLIDNGDFQTDADRDGVPDGWPASSVAITYPSEGGGRHMRLAATEPGKAVQAFRKIAIPPDVRALELTFRARHEGIRAGEQNWHDGRIIMNLKDAAGKEVGPRPPHPNFGGTSKGWTQRSVQFLVPEGTASLEFMPSLFHAAAGTLEFDDFRLVPASGKDQARMDESAKRAAEEAARIERDLAAPPKSLELEVQGKGLVDSNGKPVWLQGLTIDSMQWGAGENVLRSIQVALGEWKANCVRLAVSDERWFGRAKGQGAGAAEAYRALVDKAVTLVAGRGAHLVLDLHDFGAPKPPTIEFWRDAAARYRNNPAVLFELFNEPHGISWKIWRDGGDLKGAENTVADVNPAENDRKTGGDICVGMQAVIDAVRATGARNMVVCGGLDWAYDLSGILEGYALEDATGNGVMYVSHIYPWKKDWQGKVLRAAERHPVIVTEVGCPADWSGFQFIHPGARIPLEGWSEDVLSMIQAHRLNWTGFSFHPTCGPNVISDWNYTPTPMWGVFVKDALAGKTYPSRKMH